MVAVVGHWLFLLVVPVAWWALHQRLLLRLILEGNLTDDMPESYMDTPLIIAAYVTT